MKKVLCFILCSVVIFSLVACTIQDAEKGAKNNSQTESADNQHHLELPDTEPTVNEDHFQEDDATLKENSSIISASSLTDFLDQFSEKTEQTLSQKTSLFQAVTNKNLTFSDYDIQNVSYVPHQSVDGKPTGNASLELYWHENDCTFCANYCEKFRLHLIYIKDGIDEAAATKGYSQTETEDFFAKEISNDKTAYVFLINSQYYCRYVVNNSIIDKEAVVEQLKTFCIEFSDMIRPGEHKS